MEIIKMETTKPEFKRILGLGVPRSGKTAFIVTLPKPVLVLSFDDGWDTLAGQKDIDVMRMIEKNSNAITVAEETQKFLDTCAFSGIPKNDAGIPYASIVLDPLSFLADHINSKSMQNLSGFDIWRDVGNRLEKIMRTMLVLDCVFYCTCHVELKQDDTKGIQTFLPDIDGKQRQRISAWFDAILFFEPQTVGGKVKYFVNPLPDARKTAGIRVPLLANATLTQQEEPDYQKLLAKLGGEPSNK